MQWIEGPVALRRRLDHLEATLRCVAEYADALKAGLEDLRRKPVGRVRDLNPAKSFEAIGIITSG